MAAWQKAALAALLLPAAAAPGPEKTGGSAPEAAGRPSSGPPRPRRRVGGIARRRVLSQLPLQPFHLERRLPGLVVKAGGVQEVDRLLHVRDATTQVVLLAGGFSGFGDAFLGRGHVARLGDR